ncbi:hypothetical protein O181_072704, partial [Austropuccinia psidii MF-1]|nr:hypothetical protein [Austropuccinia psidii MF-1]
DYYYPSKSFSNAFSSTKSCAALVGNTRTSSSQSSIHIPSLNSHQSLTSSRDEIFKEIQDVGKVNSVSSLHLIFGNMNLPPSSYLDSLEELWDEEEDPEEVKTVMKVVPSAYHQYLDVFSKAKAEKLPPHHSCDYHIKLEGSLPPVGVIYSLSNQESDTLRAYISENVEKGFIRPSSSSTGEPVLLVKKKDGGLCLCVDYRKLNSVTRKNKYPVPLMNQLLIVFNGSSLFSNIELCGAYNLLRIKEGDENLTCFGTKYGSCAYLVMPFGLTNAPASFQNLSVSSTQRGLHHRSNPSLPTIVETNASNYALGDVLSQVSDSGKHPIAFDSRKPIPAELNYEIHDKELLGIVWAVKSWRAFLIYLPSPFQVLTDNSSLQYFMSSKAHWAEFCFSITYRPGFFIMLG